MLPNLPSLLLKFIFHNTRLYGWVPAGVTMARYRYGRLTLLFYCMVRRTNAWRSLVHQLFKYGMKDSPASFRSELTAPLKPPSEKRYMIALHPHGLLCDGWHMIVAKAPESFLPDYHKFMGVDNLNPFLCFSPVIKYVPGHQECYRDRCGGASAKDVEKVLRTTNCNPAICPGGFAEAVWCWSDENIEYSWLENNSRFIAVAIKHGLDIVPSYTYGVTSMYKTNTFFRQELAEIAQKTSIPTVMATGKILGVPCTEDVITVVYDPFPVDKYTLNDVDRAHEDYKKYLKECFDRDKAKYGMGHMEMQFIGPRKKGKGAAPPIRSRL